MAITVANLIAQVGADLTQFKLGMNEVDARLAQVRVRGEQVQRTAEAMRRTAESSFVNAERAASRLSSLESRRPVVAANTSTLRAQLTTMRQGIADTEASIRALSGVRTKAATDARIAARNTIADVREEMRTVREAYSLSARELREIDTQATRLNRTIAASRQRGRALSSRANEYETVANVSNDVAQAIALRRQQDATEHRTRAFNSISSSALTAGGATELALGYATKVGADFNQQLVLAAHNTTLTTAGVVQMTAAVKQMGMESGADLGELVKGFRLIQNFGYTASQSTDLLRVAMRAAVATGSDMAVTSELLAKATTEFNLPIARAATTMSIMVTAANRSSLEMDQMVHVGGQLYATAANLGVSFIEANAALVLYTKHGLSASEASVQLRNDINKIIAPSAKVQKILASMTKKTGIDLTGDFSTQGLRAKGMLKIWNDVVAAAHKIGANPVDLAAKLFPNLRGTVGALISTGTGFKQFAQEIDALNNVVATRADPVTKMYQDSLKQLNQQLGRVKNAGTFLAQTVANALTPAIIRVINATNSALTSFDALDNTTKSNVVQFVAMAGVALIVAGTVGKLIVGIVQLRTALLAFGVAEEALTFASFLSVAGPVIAGIAAVAAALGAVYLIAKIYGKEVPHVTDEQVKQAKSHEDLARKTFETSGSVNQLVQRYISLRDGTDKSNAKQKEMRDILAKLVDLSPDLIKGFDAQQHAVGLVADAAERAAGKFQLMAIAAADASLKSLQAQQQNERTSLSNTVKQEQLRLQYGTVAPLGTSDYMVGQTNVGSAFGNTKPGTMSSYNLYRDMTPEEKAEAQQQLADHKQRLKDMANQEHQAKYDLYTARNPEKLLHTYHQRVKDAAALPGGANPWGRQPSTGGNTNFGGDDKKKQKKTDADRALEAAQELLKGLQKSYFDMTHEGTLAELQWERQSGRLAELAKYSRLAADNIYNQAAAQAQLNDVTKVYNSARDDAREERSAARKRQLAEIESSTPNRNMLNFEFTDPNGKYHKLWHDAQNAPPIVPPLPVNNSGLVTPVSNGVAQMQEGVKRYPYNTKYGDVLYASRQEAAGVIDWSTQQPHKDKLADVELLRKKGKTSENDEWDPFFVQLARSLKGNSPEERLKEFEAALTKSGRGIIKFPSDEKAYKKFAGNIVGGVAPMAITPNTMIQPIGNTKLQQQYIKDANLVKVLQDQADQRDKDANLKAAKGALTSSITKLDNPAEKELSPYAQMLQDLKGDKNLWGMLQGKGVNATAGLDKLSVSQEDIAALKSLNDGVSTAAELLAKLYEQRLNNAKAADDHAKQTAKETSEVEAYSKFLQDSYQKSVDDLLHVKGGDDAKQGAWNEYQMQVRDVNKETFDDPQTTQAQKDAIIAKAKATFELVYANQQQIKEAKELVDINKQVEKGIESMRQSIRHSVDDINITDEQWRKMTKDEQKSVEKLKNMKQVRELIGNIMSGVEQIFYNSLIRIREQGFKGLFSYIVQSFDQMLYELAAKWLASQFYTLLINQIPKLMGAAFGSSPGDGSGDGSVPITNEPIPAGARAIGGPVQKGMSYIVGENGRERITMGGDGYVTPTNKMGQQATQHITNQRINIYGVKDARDLRRTSTQVGRRSAEAARMAMNKDR